MNASVNSINGQMNDFTNLTPDEQQLIEAYRVGRAERAKQPTAAAPASEPVQQPVTEQKSEWMDIETKILLAKFRKLSPESKAALLEDMRQEAGQLPAAPETAENASVHTIAKSVMSRLLTNEVGVQLFPMGFVGFENKSDVLEGIYLDLVDGIIAGLAGCDMDELHIASCLGSVASHRPVARWRAYWRVGYE